MYKIGDRIKFKYGNEIYIGTIIEINKKCYTIKELCFYWNNELIDSNQKEGFAMFEDVISKYK